MPATPALIGAGGSIRASLISGLMGKSAAEAAAKRSPEEQALFNQQRSQASQLFGAGMPAIKSTLDYYQNLLNGNRAARASAVSGEAQDVASAYQGADQAVKQRLVGGERDQALAENARQRSGQIARLVTGQRPAAANALAGLAPSVAGAGASGTAGLLTNSSQNRQHADEIGLGVGSSMASGLGSLIARLVDSYGGSKGWNPNKLMSGNSWTTRAGQSYYDGGVA